MKKLLAVILSVICIFSCAAVPASASVIGEVVTNVVDDYLDIEGEKEYYAYGVIYEMQTFSGVTLIYKPMATIKFENPGIYTITDDKPLAIDHIFVAWKDSAGNYYYPGDQIYVDGQITLYAVWDEKDNQGDTDIRIIRVIKTTVAALQRILKIFLGVFDTSVEFYEAYLENIEEIQRSITIDLPVKYAVYEDGRIKVCINTPALPGLSLTAPTGTVSLTVDGNTASYDYKFSSMTDGDDCMILLVEGVSAAAGSVISFTVPAGLFAGDVEVKGYTSKTPIVYETVIQHQETNSYDAEITVS